MKPAVLLSYDVEEFDMPFEYKGSLPFEEQIAISTRGLEKLLPLLDKYKAKATFYCTGRYAETKPDIIRQLYLGGHEIASHTYHHSRFENEDLRKSKSILENIIQHPVYGLRMPRMMPVDAVAVQQAGYQYNSSLNPCWLPGRYNHLNKPRTAFMENGLLQFPASVTPRLRLPLFWLSFHNFPFSFYWHCCRQTIQQDGYLNLYYHPWEFVDYRHAGNAVFPGYVTRHCGSAMLDRTVKLLQKAQQKGYDFSTTYGWLQKGGKLIV